MQQNVPPTTSGTVVTSYTLEELVVATASSLSADQSHVQFDLSSKTISKSVVLCKPTTKAQLEAETWRTLYTESREP